MNDLSVCCSLIEGNLSMSRTSLWALGALAAALALSASLAGCAGSSQSVAEGCEVAATGIRDHINSVSDKYGTQSDTNALVELQEANVKGVRDVANNVGNGEVKSAVNALADALDGTTEYVKEIAADPSKALSTEYETAAKKITSATNALGELCPNVSVSLNGD